MFGVVEDFEAGKGDKAKRRRPAVPSHVKKAAADEAPSFSKRPPRHGPGPSEVVILDGDGRIVVVNKAWRNTAAAYGLGAHNTGVGARYVDVLCAFLPDLDRGDLERRMQHLLSGAADDLRLTLAIPAPDGPRWRDVQITPLSVGTTGRFVAVHDDRTELLTTLEALQSTSQQLHRARDDERQRIAIELHDGTSQHLAAMSLDLARLRRASPPDILRDEIMEEISRSLTEALKETRVLSYLMKPRILGQDGLAATVLEFLEGFARRTGLEVALKVDGPVEGLPGALQHAALRIVQEALLNAHRHAEAHRASVGLSVNDGLLAVSVTDDGRGMQTGEGEAGLGEKGMGVGIPGMRARTQQFSGDLAISSDATGTRVVALLPLP